MSRLNRYEKKRKNTKLITGLGSLAIVLVILFIGFIVLPFGDDNAASKGESVEANVSQTEDENQSDEGSPAEDNAETDESGEDSTSTANDHESSAVESEETNDEQSSNAGTTSESENSEDTSQTVSSETYIEIPSASQKENVIEVYQDKWQAVQTEQEGKHVATFDDTTKDWDEMIQSISMAAGLSPNEWILWRVHNGGNNQTAVATVSDKQQTKTYRVYTAWVEDTGWKPMKVEVLKQNKYKSETEDETNTEE